MKTGNIDRLFEQNLVVINMGLEIFAENLNRENVKVLQMNWKPPAGGNEKMLALLARLGK